MSSLGQDNGSDVRILSSDDQMLEGLKLPGGEVCH